MCRSGVERTISRRRREKAASRFRASAVARFASTSLRCRDDARRHNGARPQDETGRGGGLANPKEDHRPWDADRARASSRPGRRTPLWAAARLPAAAYPHGFAENVLVTGRHFPLSFQSRLHIPGNKFREVAIKKWDAHLDRRCHAHLVVIGEIQRRHENFGVEIKHLVQEIGVLHFVESGQMLRGWIECRLPAAILACTNRLSAVHPDRCNSG